MTSQRKEAPTRHQLELQVNYWKTRYNLLDAKNKRMSKELAIYRANDKSGVYANCSKEED